MDESSARGSRLIGRLVRHDSKLEDLELQLLLDGLMLRERVDRLIYASLSRFGVLVLGQSDSITLVAHEHRYAILDEESHLYRKADGLQRASADGIRLT
jgi:hypothetical protein